MPGKSVKTPNLAYFLDALKENKLEKSTELLIQCLGRRQIRGSKNCALATAHFLSAVVTQYKAKDVDDLLDHVRQIGSRLIAANPRELAVGNIVRRVLGLIREVSGTGEDDDGRSELSSVADGHDEPRRPELLPTMSTFSPLKHGATELADAALTTEPPTTPRRPIYGPSGYSSFAMPSTRSAMNLFGLLAEPTYSPTGTPTCRDTPDLNFQSLNISQKCDPVQAMHDLKLDIVEGMNELLDEIDIAAEQISETALNYITTNDMVLAQGGSPTIQQFLAAAASKKRKFTVFCVEGEPNEAAATRNMILTGGRDLPTDEDDEDADGQAADYKPLIAMGINVVLIPDSAVYAIMSSVNKVLLAPHTVLANGGLVANGGACTIAAAAQAHKVPVLALSGVYKLSPLYPLDTDELREIGGAGTIGGSVGSWGKINVVNPMWDYVAPDKVNLYITNLGGHAPSYLYRIVADHYDKQDVNLGTETTF